MMNLDYMDLRSSLSPVLLLMVLIVSGCQSEYSRTVKRELASGAISDSLIFEFKMGQTQKDFYEICWKMNKEKLIGQGSRNQFARYIIEPDSSSAELRIEMLFYGIFDTDKIMNGMTMRYSYLSWSPWNTDTHADKLISYLKSKFLEDYPGNKFIRIHTEYDEYPAYVKIDGNRQILMYAVGKKDVVVKIEDLRKKDLDM